MLKKKLVFFDRDGVVNLEDEPYGYKIETFYFAPYFMELFLELKKRDSLCFLITNQSGINRGNFTEDDFYILTNFMQSCIISSLTIPLRLSGFTPKNIAFDKVYFCPHTQEENCDCRKPKNKMIQDAIKEFSINLEDFDSYMLGDKDTDMMAALASNIKTRIIIGEESSIHHTHRVTNLKEAMEIILV